MCMNIILKKVPEDFVVRETQSAFSATEAGDYQYFSVRKKNYETFDVVSAISDLFNISRDDIGFSGLKDRDGVTEQYFSVKSEVARQVSAAEFNAKYCRSDSLERFIHLHNTGMSGDCLMIADLLGNTFDIIGRSIDSSLAERLKGLGTVSFVFINYYDTQRFGVPNGEYLTHKVGESLENNDFESAVSYINRIADSQDIIERPLKNKADLFERIDPRKRAFYLSSYSSYQWNSHIQNVLRATVDPGDLISEKMMGIPYLYAKRTSDIFPLIANGIEYKYKRHTIVDGKISVQPCKRPEFIQIIIRCSEPEPDEYHEGKSKCRFRFFLPSGCYATMALRQFILALENEQSD